MESIGGSFSSVMPEGLYTVQGSRGSYFTPSLWTKEDRGCHFTPSVIGNQESDYPRSISRSDGNVDTTIQTSNSCSGIQETSELALEKDDDDDKDTNPESNAQKQSQVASTIKWLAENYERAEGVCLPRCVLYTHYLDFCKKMKYNPAGAATFGKIIRQKFPKLTTRRLGTRGQSKYHYYGIGIKETSIYYHSVYSGKGLTRFSGIKIKTEGSNRKYSLSAKTGTLLPDFPDADNFILPEHIQMEKMQTFIMMYRTHCQRILDTVISANFDEVQNFLLHFWQGMPEHLTELLKIDMTADIVALCDSILYKVLIDVLIPSSIQDLPESLGAEIKMFVKKLPYWLESSLEDISQNICTKKMEVLKTFAHSIKRQMAFVRLAQTTRSVLLNHDLLNQMIEDIANVDFSELTYQASYMTPSGLTNYKDTIFDFFDDFQKLLTKQAPIEAYTEWLDNIIDKCVLQNTHEKGGSLTKKASRFLLQWETFCSLFMRDLTLLGATSFGSFHLMRIMCDEYIFLVMETQQDLNKEQLLQKNVQTFMKNAEEIKMRAKVRTQTSKHQASLKGKKRKHSEDPYDSGDDHEFVKRDESRVAMIDNYSSMNGTAFSRPQPSVNRDLCLQFSDDTCRSNFSNHPHPLSPLKHYPSMGSGGFDRPTYFHQYGLNSYPDIMAGPTSFPAPRAVQNYSDAHVQSFQSVPLSSNVSQQAGGYWSDSIHDPYTSYGKTSYSGYNKFHSSLDTYNKPPSLLRAASYSHPMNRSAFDTSRSYYRGHDNYQVGGALAMSGFSSNFMDIAQPPGQYPRQDGMFFQDDIYPGGVTTSFTSFGKPYLTTPFR